MQDQIKDFIQTNYKGSYRFIKEQMFINKFGKDCHTKINKEISFIDKPFSLKVYCWVNNIVAQPVCKCCNKNVKFNSNNGWQLYCSNKCRISDIKNIQDKKRKTNIERYGASNVLISKHGISKKNETLQSKYGVSNYTQSNEYKQRIKNGDIKRTHCGNKIQLTHKLKYYNYLLNNDYILPAFNFNEYKGTYHRYQLKCKKCDNTFEYVLGRQKLNEQICPFCNPEKGTKNEKLIKKFLDNLGINYIYRARKEFDNEYEIDVYIPEYKLGIEINGLYWHSEKLLDKHYHVNKQEFFKQKGIQLIQIFEDELQFKRKVVLSKLKHLLHKTRYKIGARECAVQLLNTKTKKSFMEKYHLQGDAPSNTNVGLFYKDRLVAVATFGKMRRVTGFKQSRSNDFELIRYATINNFAITGGLSKLIKYFKQLRSDSIIYSYCDKRWSAGNTYIKAGFELVRETVPNYWYTKHFIVREHRWKYRKTELPKLLKIYDPNLTEHVNMTNNGYTRIWDCGNYLFQLI
jgi:G:T-mismatch repair DNA endonuclease (very short patch repair protein)